MNHPKLSTPPIIESVFLVRFKESLEEELIESFSNELLKLKYSKKDASESPKRGNKYVLTSDNNDKTIRISLDSFSLHNLLYLSFEEIYAEFKAIIDVLAQLNDALVIDLLSVRYVNSIEVTKVNGLFKVEDYLTYKIETPFTISNFFLQLLVNNESHSDMEGVIVHTIRPKSTEDGESESAIFLDIIIREKADFNITQIDKTKDVLFMMREFKNDLFFKIVQPKIIEKYA